MASAGRTGVANMVHRIVYFLYGRAHWCHLGNRIELTVCGGDTVLCQVSLTTYYYNVIIMMTK